LQSGKIRHALFFVHLTVEKALKAVYTKRMAQVPPRSHDLINLAFKCGLNITDEQVDVMARVNVYNMEGRYADDETPEISAQAAEELRKRGEGIYQWLIKQL